MHHEAENPPRVAIPPSSEAGRLRVATRTRLDADWRQPSPDRDAADVLLLSDTSPEVASAAAAEMVARAVRAAAEKAAAAAESARATRRAATAAAEYVAAAAVSTATAVKDRADRRARVVAAAASQAATRTAAGSDPQDPRVADTAADMARTVAAAALAQTEETAVAAAVVACAVAAAAAHVAYVDASNAVKLEQQVIATAAELGTLSSAAGDAAAQIARSTRARSAMTTARDAAGSALVSIGQSMDDVTSLIREGSPPANLARRLGAIARSLHAEASPDGLLRAIVRAAVDHVPGADCAGVTLVSKKGELRTLANTDRVVDQMDDLQRRLGQGPCLEIDRDHVTIWSDDLRTEARWPSFSRAAVDGGVRSVLSVELYVQDHRFGSLNVYSAQANAFGVESQEAGFILAAHAALALSGSERDGNFRVALSSRDVIGQAKGILMERNKIGADAAFKLLVSASQQNNRKVSAIAEIVIQTGVNPTSENLRAY